MKTEEPHYLGHRDRLKSKFYDNGGDALSDYELLELILFQTIPRKDVKPLAKNLIKKFGSFAEVLSAPIEALEKEDGISKNTAISLSVVRASSIKMAKQKILKKQVLANWQQVLDYCHTQLAWDKKEQFRVIYLNKKNFILADELQGDGTIDHTPVYPREVVKRALDLGATSVILIHNHPSGNSDPSKDDIMMTKEIKRTLSGVGVVLHDHIIIANQGHYSFKSNMLI